MTLRPARTAVVTLLLALAAAAGDAQAPPSVVRAHAGTIHSMAIAADGRMLATASLDTAVKLWLLPSLQPLAALRHPDRATAVAFWGGSLASGGADGVIRRFSLPAGGPLNSFAAHPGAVQALAASPDGKLLASCGSPQDNAVRLWSLDGKLVRALQGHGAECNALAISPDGTLLASGSDDRTIRLWRLPEGEPLATLKGHSGDVHGLAIAPDGSLLASVSADRTVKLWSLPLGRPLASLRGHGEIVNAIAVAPDGRLAVTGGDDRVVRVWSLAERKSVTAFDPLPDAVKSLALAADGTIYAGGAAGHLRLLPIAPAATQ
jgi:WD40 repeat protein